MEQITRALGSADEETRLHGLKALAVNDPEDSLPLIFEAFGDQSWRVRKEAIELFLRLPVSRDLVGEIIELLHAEENAGLRNAAVEILVRLGRDAVPMLIDQARCPDHDVRKFILDILGDIEDHRAISVLVQGLSDEDSNVRAAAAENLGKLKAEKAVPDLLAAMSHPDLLLQFTILDALSRIGAPVAFDKLVAFKDEKLLRKALVDCLGQVGDESAIPALVAALTDTMRNVQEAAILAVHKIAERYPGEVTACLLSSEPLRTADTVVKYLGEQNPGPLRRSAARIMGWLGAGGHVIEILDLVEVESLQQDALQSLVDIGAANPQALVDAWQRVAEPKRAYLAYIIGEAGCTDGVSLLQGSLAAEDRQLQRMAAYALGRLGIPEVLPDLVDCLNEATGDVQEAATQALVNLGRQYPHATLEALQPLISDADPTQRKYAVTVIGKLDDPAVLDVLSMALKDPSADVRRAAVNSFEGRDMGEHLSIIRIALTDEDAEVRRTVVELLGTTGDDEVVDSLQLALADEDIWVRAAAVRSLGRIGADHAETLILKAMHDPVGLVSIAAMETLADLQGKAFCPGLVTALDHPDEEVVMAALNLLGMCDAGEWFTEHSETLINHPFWAVRTHFARLAVTLLGDDAATLLQRRLAVETEEQAREEIETLLRTLSVE